VIDHLVMIGSLNQVLPVVTTCLVCYRSDILFKQFFSSSLILYRNFKDWLGLVVMFSAKN
jgi:hypothetical protein